MSWSQAELDALRKAYASGTLRVSYDGRSVEYGSEADLLRRIRIRPRCRVYGAAGRAAPRPAPRGDRHARPQLRGARVGRRTEGWVVAGTSANAEIGTALVRLRDRSRDLVRNTPMPPRR